MRFWLTLVIGTITVSSVLSWLYLRMEAAPHPAIQMQSETGAVPCLEVVGHQFAGDPKTVALQHEKSQMDVEYRQSIAVANQGEGELMLTVARRTCGCVKNVFLDDVPMPEGLPLFVPPKGQKQLHIVWKYETNVTQSDRDRRFAVEFITNDPETPVFRVEITTHVVR
ncbi:hypothetical protein HRbin36_00015 [bacterium HR36]|nr:hypothetical protein HRbin36_00015 [bacterium HR36]